MAKQMVQPWTKLLCTECGYEEHATRAMAEMIDVDNFLCESCSCYKGGFDAGFEEGLAQAEEAAMAKKKKRTTLSVGKHEREVLGIGLYDLHRLKLFNVLKGIGIRPQRAKELTLEVDWAVENDITVTYPDDAEIPIATITVNLGPIKRMNEEDLDSD